MLLRNFFGRQGLLSYYTTLGPTGAFAAEMASLVHSRLPNGRSGIEDTDEDSSLNLPIPTCTLTARNRRSP